jgi:starch synthase (maltosyl-transferring)
MITDVPVGEIDPATDRVGISDVSPSIDQGRYPSLVVHDEVTGETYAWGQENYVRLEPWRTVAHVLVVR